VGVRLRISYSLLVCVLVSCSSAQLSQPGRSIASQGIEVEVLGGGEDSFVPPTEPIQMKDPDHPQVVIVGAGLAGLSSAVYLTDRGVRVMVLEKEDQVGGLASYGSDGPHVYDRGAAYWTFPYEEEAKILKHIGITNIEKKDKIYSPIDSYYVRGKFYPDVWEPESLAELPASFELFKFEIEKALEEHKIPDQPIEENEQYGGSLELDRLSAQQWIEQMPAGIQNHLVDPKASAINQRFQSELAAGKLPGPTGMQDVLELMQLYCRSALGGEPDRISAIAFANFYISEIVPRYTTSYGTGLATKNMRDMLRAKRDLAALVNRATVKKITNLPGAVEVAYDKGGVTHHVQANYVIFAAQLRVAPALIERFADEAPEQARLMSTLDYAHYSVHALFVEGHPFRASYDTWVHASDYTEDDFTDVILGRWMEPGIKGYEGMRNFAKKPPGDGIVTIYHPLSPKWLNSGYTTDQAKQIAVNAANRLDSVFAQMPRDLWQGPLRLKKIQTSRWPYSVHVPAPGHYTTKARIMRKPFGRVYFANNNLGTPAFEEALFRGHCAADNILKQLKKNFKFEKWSRCPEEKASNAGVLASGQ
jgi:protoporphyrinogen oxidase